MNNQDMIVGAIMLIVIMAGMYIYKLPYLLGFIVGFVVATVIVLSLREYVDKALMAIEAWKMLRGKQ